MSRLSISIAVVAVFVLGWIGLTPLATQAQSYPNHPVTLIVPSGPAGDIDRIARGIAQFLPIEIGQPVLVENHAGAANMIGHKYFLTKPDDGYTFMVTSAHPYIATNILAMNAGFQFDDFDYMNTLWADYVGIFVNKSRPWKTLGQLIEAAKANPGKITLSTVYGSAPHIALLALEEALHMPQDAIRVVTFDSGGDTKAAVAGGTVDLTGNQLNGMETVKDFVAPLAIFENQPVPGVDVPIVNDTLKAYGTSVPSIKGSIRTFIGHPALKKDYPDRYAFMMAALQRTVTRPDFQAWAKSQNIPAGWKGPEASRAELLEEYDVWKKYVYLLKK